jgi:hypothetical protein
MFFATDTKNPLFPKSFSVNRCVATFQDFINKNASNLERADTLVGQDGATEYEIPISGLIQMGSEKFPVQNSSEGLGNITLSGPQTLNGSLTSGHRFLAMEQTDASENGIYVSQIGAWQRAEDFSSLEHAPSGSNVRVINTGSLVNLHNYVQTVAPTGVLGTSDMEWKRTTGFTRNQITFNIGDGTNVIPANVEAILGRVPYNCEIVKSTLTANETGSISIDLWVDSYANYPPTVADTITASSKPNLTSGIKSEDSTLTSWTTAISEGDAIIAHVDPTPATVKRISLVLDIVTG